MVVASTIGWMLNMFFEIVVLKMLSVYFTFYSRSIEQNIKIQTRINSFIFWYILIYFTLGLALNILSFIYLKNFIEVRANKDHQTVLRWFVTVIGIALFMWDMMILVLFNVTINLMIKHFSKQYIVNRFGIWIMVIIFSVLFIINNIW
jgi:hypothetical protein